VTERRQFKEKREAITMMKSTINKRVQRLQELMNESDKINDQMRLLADLIAKDDRKERDLILYGPNPTA
jgi:hypothetical protein